MEKKGTTEDLVEIHENKVVSALDAREGSSGKGDARKTKEREVKYQKTPCDLSNVQFNFL